MRIALVAIGSILLAIGVFCFVAMGDDSAPFAQAALLASLCATLILGGLLFVCTGIVLFAIRKISSSIDSLSMSQPRYQSGSGEKSQEQQIAEIGKGEDPSLAKLLSNLGK